MESKNQDELQRSLNIDLSKSLLTAEDAFRCLTDAHVKIILPSPNARACNNLGEYFQKSTQNLPRNQNRNKSKTPSYHNETLAVPLVRNFDRILKKPSNSDEFGKTSFLIDRPRRVQHNVIDKAQNVKSNPNLIFLRDRINEKVKILIRRRRKCPYISRVIEYKGKLVLFDKHMNLFLDDVIESFSYNSGDKLIKRARHRESVMLRGDNIIMVS